MTKKLILMRHAKSYWGEYGRLHFKGSSNTFRTEHLLTQNDQCWNSLVQFTGPNCDVQKLTELQANVRTFLKVADS